MECPICGQVGTLKIQYMYQCAHEHKILKNGTISKAKSKKVDIGSEDWSAVYCINCHSYWSSEDYNKGFNIKNGHIHFDDEELDRIAYANERSDNNA